MREKEFVETEDFRGYKARNDSLVRRNMYTRESAMSILGTELDIVLDIQKELGDGVRLDDTGENSDSRGHEIRQVIKADFSLVYSHSARSSDISPLFKLTSFLIVLKVPRIERNRASQEVLLPIRRRGRTKYDIIHTVISKVRSGYDNIC